MRPRIAFIDIQNQKLRLENNIASFSLPFDAIEEGSASESYGSLLTAVVDWLENAEKIIGRHFSADREFLYSFDTAESEIHIVPPETQIIVRSWPAYYVDSFKQTGKGPFGPSYSASEILDSYNNNILFGKLSCSMNAQGQVSNINLSKPLNPLNFPAVPLPKEGGSIQQWGEMIETAKQKHEFQIQFTSKEELDRYANA